MPRSNGGHVSAIGRRRAGALARLTAALLVLLSAIVPAAVLAQSAAEQPDPIGVLRHYGIIRGAPGGDLRLGESVTRAEMAVLLMRALGQEEETQFFAGQDPFTDINRHWARGHIALAARLGLVRGYPDGSFRPGQPVSYIEVMALLLRLVNQEPTGGAWPDAVFQQAARLGIQPPGIVNPAAAANLPAARLHVFQSLHLAMSRVAVNETGQTLLQRIDPHPPVLALDPLPAQTDAGQIPVTGSVGDAVMATVNGRPVGILDDRIRTEVSLLPGTNTVTVTAADLAGNVARTSFSVLRGEPLTAIEASGPDRLAPGDRAAFQVIGRDTSGDEIPLPDLAVQVEGDVGAFDLATLTLTAGAKPGSGRLVFRAQGVEHAVPVIVLGPAPDAAALAIAGLNGGRPLVAGEAATVEVEVRDKAGRPLPGDTGRTVSLAVDGVAGATVEPAAAATRDGRARFTVQVPAAGYITLTARAERLKEIKQEVRALPRVRVVLTADPLPLNADGYSTAELTARLVDPEGRPVLNDSGRDLVIEVDSGTGVALSGVELRIGPGGFAARTPLAVTAGKTPGTVTITGAVASGQGLPVDPLAVTLVSPERGRAVAIQLTGPRAPVTAGEPAKFTVEVVDGYNRPIPDGRYAFRLRVSAEHDAGADSRLPAGIGVRIGVVDLDPALGTVARTLGGKAAIYVTSDRSGVVTVTPILIGPAEGAYDELGVPGAAGATLGLRVKEAAATFRGTPAGLRLEVDSPLAAGAAAGAVRLGSTATAVVRVIVADSKGARVPGTREKVTLERVDGDATLPPTTLQRDTVDGVAEFMIRPGAAAGSDHYRAAHTKLGISDTVVVGVQDAPPDAPLLVAARGALDAVPGDLNIIAPDEESMELELETAPGIAAIQVFRDGQAAALFDTGPLDLTGGRTLVRVPKSLLPAGTTRYQVTQVNAAGASPRSTASAPVLNSNYLSARLTRARYDAGAHLLTVLGSGLNKADTVDPALLTITGPGGPVSLAGATVAIQTSGQFTVSLAALPAATAQLEDPAAYGSAAVTLRADLGWYRNSQGHQAAAAAGVAVTPMAHIAAAHLDLASRTLELEGTGFLSGKLNPARLKLHNLANGREVSLSGMTFVRHGDLRLTITLSTAAAALLGNADDFYGPDIRLVSDAGWLADSGAQMAPVAGGSPMYIKPGLASAAFDAAGGMLVLLGSGFAGGIVEPARLAVVDLDGGPSSSLDLAGASASVAAAGRIEITLTPEQTAALTGAGFAGEDIYVTAGAGWFTAAGIPAGPLPAGVLRLPQP